MHCPLTAYFDGNSILMMDAYTNLGQHVTLFTPTKCTYMCSVCSAHQFICMSVLHAFWLVDVCA